jgi:hypothetical protein
MIGIYCGAYFILMVRDVPVWKKGRVAFRSSYRCAGVGESPPGSVVLTIPNGAVSTWNYVFLPADWLFYVLTDIKLIDTHAGNYWQTSNSQPK